MNYLIKISILFLLFSSNLEMFGQNPMPDTLQLKITGKYKVPIQPVAYLLLVTFEEDPSKCDPSTGYSPLEEKLSHFKEATTTQGIEWKNVAGVKMFFIQNSHLRQKSFEYVTDDFDKILTVANICQNQQIRYSQVTYIYSEFSSDDLANMGGNAIEDAQRKAETIAKKYGKKRIELLSIVDNNNGLNRSAFRDYEYGFNRVPKFSTWKLTDTYLQLIKKANQFFSLKRSKIEHITRQVTVGYKIY